MALRAADGAPIMSEGYKVRGVTPRRRSLFLEPPLSARPCPGWPRETAPPDCSISRAMCLAPALPVSECALRVVEQTGFAEST